MSDLCGMHRANLFEEEMSQVKEVQQRQKTEKKIQLQVELIKTEQKDICGNDRLQIQVYIGEIPTMSYKAYTPVIIHTNLIKKSFAQSL